MPIRLDQDVLASTKRSVLQVFASNSSGSGFVVATRQATYCLTNLHVVQSSMTFSSNTNASQSGPVRVRTAFGASQDALVWKWHLGLDIALLRISPGLSDAVAAVVDTSTAAGGQAVFIWGAPYGEALVPIDGIVHSSYQGSVGLNGVQKDAQLIRLRLAAQPGNSGGPVMNLAGRVLGVVTQRSEQQGVSDGYSIAVATRTFWPDIHGFIESGQ
ncbi:MAG: trypsin-like peptidase domain-containing protein [Ideonella sp.]|nr:trypsin-like peptidase domain-containing protein [Ideonella sp.]